MSDPGAVHPVVLNVGGTNFSSSMATLTRYPDSLLARLVHRGTHGQGSGQQQPLFVDRDGTMFRHVLAFLRDGALSPGLQGPELRSLGREAVFYELHALARAVQQAEAASRSELLEVRFSLQEGGAAFFRVFGSRADSVLELAERVHVSSEHEHEQQQHLHMHQQQHHPSWAGWPLQAAPTWSSSGPAASLERVSLQRPSHHDFVFQCGPAPSSTGASFVRYVSIEPDQRRLTNGVNVLGLLIDTVLREGFRLVAARTASLDDRVECYTFERGHPMGGQHHGDKATAAGHEQPIGGHGKAANGKPAKK
ncbi:potassium channel regulatory protein-like [Lethenteron reissneri]|uniref:potassium channel regulatory protein-like n=1 Tax=Lethenteron reissneri TaxID=7753 RepID=UPI002AB7C1DD|nr:potassium channel regulatory protein-like [Lethenteron reissneri]XP_061426257.1 potassium channel regulatory protein-like [Lethenteron reissneri]XP_061426258.1 potassium channel regulatory protein-like [Lethenteron reissneri]